MSHSRIEGIIRIATQNNTPEFVNKYAALVSQINTTIVGDYDVEQTLREKELQEQLPPVVQQPVEPQVEEKPVEHQSTAKQLVITQLVPQQQQQVQTNKTPKQTTNTRFWTAAEEKFKLNVDNNPTKFTLAQHRIRKLQKKYAKDLTWWENTFFGIFKYLFSSKYEAKQAKHDEMSILRLCTDFAALSIAASSALDKPLVTRGFFSKSEKLLNTIANESDKLLPAEEKKEQPSYASTYEPIRISKMDF